MIVAVAKVSEVAAVIVTVLACLLVAWIIARWRGCPVTGAPPKPAKHVDAVQRRAVWFVSGTPVEPGQYIDLVVRLHQPLLAGTLIADGPAFTVELRIDFEDWTRRFQRGPVPAHYYARGTRVPMGLIPAHADVAVLARNTSDTSAGFVAVLLGHEAESITLAQAQAARARLRGRLTCSLCAGTGERLVEDE